MKQKLNFMANLLLTAAFAAVFASCGEDDPETVDDDNKESEISQSNLIRTSVESLEVPLTDGTYTIDVASSAGWNVTADSAWAKVSPSTASGNAAITVTVNANTTVPDYRTCNIVFSIKGATAHTVQVRQTGLPSVKEVVLDKTSIDLVTSATLHASVLPDNALIQSIKWSSSNPGVATVDAAGAVTRTGKGSTVITATAHNGKTAQCTVATNSLNIYALGGSGLWKNGEVIQTFDGSSSGYTTYSVFVSGDDIYVAGTSSYFRTYSRSAAVMWKNGVRQTLYETTYPCTAVAASVFVKDGDVYVAGRYGAATTYGYTNYPYHMPALWKNGQRMWSYTAGFEYGTTGGAMACNVYVSGSDTYVAGYWEGDAMLWKNGMAQTLGTGWAGSVCVAGNDVYVGGNSGGNAVLWKNGIMQDLGAGGVSDVYAVGSDVYVAGYSGGNAVLWKNGIMQSLGAGEAISVYVSGNNVYVGGNSGNNTVLWINGVQQELIAGQYSSSIFVTD
jgi:hypothetical protein